MWRQQRTILPKREGRLRVARERIIRSTCLCVFCGSVQTAADNKTSSRTSSRTGQRLVPTKRSKRKNKRKWRSTVCPESLSSSCARRFLSPCWWWTLWPGRGGVSTGHFPPDQRLNFFPQKKDTRTEFTLVFQVSRRRHVWLRWVFSPARTYTTVFLAAYETGDSQLAVTSSPVTAESVFPWPDTSQCHGPVFVLFAYFSK